MAYPLRGAGLIGPLGPGPTRYQQQFGTGVALSANGLVMAVGMPGMSNGGFSNAGTVAIYDWVAGAWVYRYLVSFSSPAANARLGASVALSGNGSVLAAGAPGVSSNTGVVRVFDLDAVSFTHRNSPTGNLPSPSNQFGASVALSEDGLLMAVGAPGATSARGRVHILLVDGASWTQRDQVAAADQANNDNFGTSVALNDAGTTLVVGALGWEGAATDQGGVYTYDYGGAVWTVRGSVLTRTGAGTLDYFGSSVALSHDGETLVVGSQRVYSYTGEVAVYARSGSAWTLAETISHPDPATGDLFATVALSGDAITLAIGAPLWEGTESNQGTVYTYGDNPPEIIACPCELIILPAARIACPAELTVINPAYRASCPSELRVIFGPYRAECQAALAVVDLDAGIQRPPRWTMRCLIDGVDESSRVTGVARVVAEEGAARIAELVIRPPAGVLLPLDYVGKPISLDYVPIYGGTGVPQRLFTGRIDTPSYDFAEGLLTLSCVDDLQNRVAALDRAAIDALVGGRYSVAVQGELDDNWDYAQARMETVAGSLDAGPAGGIRVTPWELPSVWATFDESTLIYPMSRVSYPQRSTLINSVAVEFDYRYARLRQRNTSLGWSGTNIDMRATGWRYPTQQEILGAANGSGWTVQNAVFYPAPAAIPHTSGGFIYPETGSIDMAILQIAQRHSQTVSEMYRFTVAAPESVTQNGVLPGNVRGALASAFDGQAWESAFDVAPLLPGGGEMDYAPDALRADAEYALQTLIDQAHVKILGSHRSTRVGNATVLMPQLDLDKRLAINTAALEAEGKVVSVTHTLDLRAGSAITEFELACFGAGGAGILTPDSLTPPPPPDPAAESQDWPSDLPSLFVATPYSNVYSDNLMGLLLNTPETILVEDVPSVGTQSFANPYYSPDVYPVEGFRVQMPGVDDADRNPVTLPAGQDYSIVLPSDTLQITQS